MSMQQEPGIGDSSGKPSPSRLDTVRRFGPGAVLAVIALLFILQNQDPTDFEFLWLSFRTGLWVMLLASLLVGVLIGWLMAVRRARRRARDT